MAESVCNRLGRDGDESIRKRNDSNNRIEKRKGNHGRNDRNGYANRGGKKQRVEGFEGKCRNCSKYGHKWITCKFPSGGAHIPKDQYRQDDDRAQNQQDGVEGTLYISLLLLKCY